MTDWKIDVRRESSLTIADSGLYIATLMDKPGWGDMETNARLITAARNSYDKHCGERAIECAEGDLLGGLLAALQAVEWIKDVGGISFCPRCKADEQTGHYDGCQLANALARARAD